MDSRVVEIQDSQGAVHRIRYYFPPAVAGTGEGGGGVQVPGEEALDALDRAIHAAFQITSGGAGAERQRFTLFRGRTAVALEDVQDGDRLSIAVFTGRAADEDLDIGGGETAGGRGGGGGKRKKKKKKKGGPGNAGTRDRDGRRKSSAARRRTMEEEGFNEAKLGSEPVAPRLPHMPRDEEFVLGSFDTQAEAAPLLSGGRGGIGASGAAASGWGSARGGAARTVDPAQLRMETEAERRRERRHRLTVTEAALEDFGGVLFQEQILKLERLNAHLVNERTWLMWIRITLTVMQTSLFFLQLAIQDKSRLRWYIFVCGGLYVLTMPYSWFTGFSRYMKAKQVLDWNVEDILPYFKEAPLDHNAMLVGVLMIITGFGFVVSAAAYL